MNILQINHLDKQFGGRKVIDNLNLSVPEHSVFGFLGQNGAGKTTTMKMVLGLLRPSGGTISVCGEQVEYGQTKTNRFIGYLPDVPEFYSYMSPMEYLRLCGEINGLPAKKIKSRGEELLELVGLSGNRRKIGGFSRGMKQRLGIAQALLNEPRLLLCDEPTSALDPVGRKEILGILSRVKGKTTVLFSTHILSDVERICDHAAVLHQGKIALCGPLDQLRENHRQDSLLIEFSDPETCAEFENRAELKPFVTGTVKEGNTLTLRASDLKKVGALSLHLLSSEGILPLRFEILEPTLESLFLEVVQ